MIRFWTFAIGLGLIVLAARNMAEGGIDLTEFRLLLALAGLLAVAQVVELIAGWVEQSYADRRDLRDAMAESDRTEVETDVAGAVLREQSSPIAATLTEVHRGGEQFLSTLTPKTSVREDPDRKGGHRPPFGYDEARAEAERNGDA